MFTSALSEYSRRSCRLASSSNSSIEQNAAYHDDIPAHDHETIAVLRTPKIPGRPKAERSVGSRAVLEKTRRRVDGDGKDETQVTAS